ncbi:TetR/AcrR family transcriptional regulator [Rathayibacter sp. VKM Ac-2630]|uniref:TetR/AcrR family transcriptional regulator n=1 Tax=Rathayibacter sp. VKM Ac-2630 TaxID=1938617 RepID=UPI000981F4F3|nr:TetR/AcrR family transcriptional regulator [Rathayibacter sp. VKM Ac-2630]OOB89495.1 TetR family transcriptional regulator [Rathayibacter sp. VKM Ac-2630]
MGSEEKPPGRRERAKADKQRRIEQAARALFAERGVSGVTTQQIADRADVAIGTLYLYAATKAELLIMVQNRKFGAAVDDGLAAAEAMTDPLESIVALITPVVACLREHPENGRTYLHELVSGDPREVHRREGLALSERLEEGLSRLLRRDSGIGLGDAATRARVITAVIHLSTTATLHLGDPLPALLARLRRQIAVVLPGDGTGGRIGAP